MFEVTTNIKQAFFNVDKVQDAIDREERTAMRKGAARIRRRQRAMIFGQEGTKPAGRSPARPYSKSYRFTAIHPLWVRQTDPFCCSWDGADFEVEGQRTETASRIA